MKQLTHWYFKILECVLVLCLAAMSIMVFANVVLRHFFESGINMSEELSRFLFIWLTFLGAIVAMRENGHLGMDMVARKLSGRASRTAVVLAQGLTLTCCLVFLWGLMQQFRLNLANTGMLTGIPMAVVYSAAYLCAVSIAVISSINLVQLARGKVSPADFFAAAEPSIE
jgi:TRAP-type C4-dicarboxylate transport system permease small subunit